MFLFITWSCCREEIDGVKLKVLWKAYLQAAENSEFNEVSMILVIHYISVTFLITILMSIARIHLLEHHLTLSQVLFKSQCERRQS